MPIDILINVCVAVIAFVAGMRTTAYLWRAKLQSVMDQWSAAEADKPPTMLLRVEQMQGQIYCYEKETNRFICQGANVEEIWATFQKLFPDVNARVVDGEDSLLDQVREQARVINEVA
jgi:hypothetical protein